jgi:hypothetical protein
VISYLGKRIEYSWSDFKRVTAAPDTGAIEVDTE